MRIRSWNFLGKRRFLLIPPVWTSYLLWHRSRMWSRYRPTPCALALECMEVSFSQPRPRFILPCTLRITSFCGVKWQSDEVSGWMGGGTGRLDVLRTRRLFHKVLLLLTCMSEVTVFAPQTRAYFYLHLQWLWLRAGSAVSPSHCCILVMSEHACRHISLSSPQ